MKLTDIIGPVMVGPSSSHTAGAVRIGTVCRKLIGGTPREAEILLHGSFLTTGRGHGTDRAIVAGIIKMDVDDARIPDSFRYAEEKGMRFSFGAIDLGEDANPNSVLVKMVAKDGRRLSVQAASIGGGRIRVEKIDGMPAGFSGDYPTLIINNVDEPGHVAKVTTALEWEGINIADMQLFRAGRGGSAMMVIECDQEIPREFLMRLRSRPGIISATYLGHREEKKA